MSPTTCPKCGRPVESMPGVPANFCTGCGCPVTSEAVRERITDLMLQGSGTTCGRRLHAWNASSRRLTTGSRRSSADGAQRLTRGARITWCWIGPDPAPVPHPLLPLRSAARSQ